MQFEQFRVIRSHDEFYAAVDPLTPPKDSFIAIAGLIEQYKQTVAHPLSIADMGCATGAFVNYLTSRFFNDTIIGYEYLESLVNVGKKIFPKIQIKQASVLNRESIPRENFDVISLLGVLSIFDDIEPVIANLNHWVKPGGKLFIHGMFNKYDVDVFLKYRLSENYLTPEYETGWNIISQKSISKILINQGAKKIQFHEFNLSVDLERNAIDPLRSWTEKLENGERYITNALCIKQPQFILEVDL